MCVRSVAYVDGVEQVGVIAKLYVRLLVTQDCQRSWY